ncbi:MAG: hypothetical protein ACE5KU_04050 [Nitrososphaerales archaeon]
MKELTAHKLAMFLLKKGWITLEDYKSMVRDLIEFDAAKFPESLSASA